MFKNFNILKYINFLPLFVIISFLIFFGWKLLSYHWHVITYPFPLEFREGAIIVPTDVLLRGGGIYDLKSQPQATYLYGFVYHYLLYPFAKIFGPTLLVHRIFSAVFIVLNGGLLFIVLARQKVPLIFNAAAILFFYAGLLFPNTTTPLSGPHSLGLFFFLASIFGPALKKYSWRSLVVSVILGLLAFYTKAYFIVGVPLLAAYLFLFVSQKKGLRLGVLFTLGLTVSIIIVNALFDLYFSNTLFANMNIAGHDVEYAKNQLKNFYTYHQYLFWMIGGIFLVEVVKKREKYETILSLSLFYFLLMTLLIYINLGQHPGSWMAYLFHLMQPFFLVFAFSLIPRLGNLNWLAVPLILWNLHALMPYFERDWKDGLKEWDTVKMIVLKSKDILNSPAIASLLVEQHKNVYDSGFTHTFRAGADRGSIFKYFLSRDDRIVKKNLEYQIGIFKAIQERKFDLIILQENWSSPFPTAPIPQYYNPVGKISVFMPHSSQRWNLLVWQRMGS